MLNYASPRPLRRALLIGATGFLAVIAVAAVPSHADISAKDSFVAIQRQVESIEPRLVKSTVLIRVSDGSGSGVIVSPDGLVMTAAHVIEGRPGRRVTAILADGRSLAASVVAYDRDADIGFVKISDAKDLPMAQIGDSSTLRRGEWVLATGHPLGQHLGRPPVLRIGRVLRLSGTRFGRETRSITTDAPIISGDSGGPLFDLSGRIVGINSMITTGSRRMTSIHMAVNLAKSAVTRIAHGETPDTWDGPPAAFASDLKKGQDALDAGNAAAAESLAKEASDIDPTSAASRLLAAHAYVHANQPTLALSSISQACDRGYSDGEALRRDPDFAPLANQPAMARLLERLDAFNGIPGDRKNDASLFTAGAPLGLNHGVVRLQSAGTDVSMGTVMSSDGDILTKASELPDGPLTCVMPSGNSVPVMRRGVDSEWDVALLKANVTGLQPLPMGDGVAVGEWAFSPDSAGSLAAIGIVGVSDMPVHGRGIATSKAYMGVRLEPLDPDALKAAGVPQGIRVEVQPDLPAARAGLQSGDIVFEAEGQPVRDPDGLMDLLIGKRPGDEVTLKLARGAVRMTRTVALMARPADLPGRAGIPEMVSGEISRVQGPFSHVIHHDSILSPSAMGGPLLDTDGKCIGLNIARADRTSTYAISARDMRDIYTRLKARN